MAKEWAKLSHCTRKQVGALIVKNGILFLMVIMAHQLVLITLVKIQMVIQTGMLYMVKQMLF